MSDHVFLKWIILINPDEKEVIMKRFRNILFARNIRHNEIAFAHAIALSRDNKAHLSFLETPEEISDISVFGLPNEAIDQLKQDALEHSRQDLVQFVELQREGIDTDDIPVEFRVVQGVRFLTIIHEVLRGGHDLVIKCTEGDGGVLSRLFSTTDMHLLRKCPCPLWLVNPQGSKTIKRIVAAVDFDLFGVAGVNDALNRQIMEMAISLAHSEGAKLHVVHAWQSMNDTPFNGLQPDMAAGMSVFIETEDCIDEVQEARERSISQLMDVVRDEVGAEIFDAVKPITHAIRGKASEVIIMQTEVFDADLLVMGTIGRIGLSGFFIGNTAESILNQVNCSVLAIKPAGFKSPVTLE